MVADVGSLRESLSGQAAVLSELCMAYLEPRLTELGITFGTFELLSAVRAAKGAVHQAELARRLSISPPSLCEALKIAVKKGLLRQETPEGNQRAKVVSLTLAGTNALDRTLEAMADLERTLRGSLDAERLRGATATLAEANRLLAQEIRVRT